MKEPNNRSSAFIKKDLNRVLGKKNGLFSVSIRDSIYEWDIIIFGPRNTPFEGGVFAAKMNFPTNYPEMPPQFKFSVPIWHPNITEDGKVCISILHPPGDDQWGYECISERWLPVRDAESVIISVISLLDSPNPESPANVEAAKQYREDKAAYDTQVRDYVKRYC